ncbi:MAG: hypothetical protein KatS3mg043_0479 [Rhodothermaceae bacterium]|nr:MAG: hypothetical protein KatS3mg043_0479 [Rhodothermaceae bacterium]
MAKYPTPGAYQEAVQHPATAFLDPALQQARPEEQAWGLPRVVTGTFAAVFPMQGRTGRWAVKCFLTDVPEQARRYRAVARHLAAHPLSCTVDFDYQPEGIRVGTAIFPVLKMAWVEGTPLNTFVQRNLDRPGVLETLAEKWRVLLRDLAGAGVAHGDLQHGNVLVVEAKHDFHLKLVDYDTMYVPALKGRKSPEIGHRNYQHPDRHEDDFGPYLDRFPGLVIYTALRACAARPELWAVYDSGENLLFRAADFYEPATSALLAELASVEAVAPLAGALQRACLLEPAAVPALEEVLAGRPVASPRRRATRRRSMERVARRGLERWFLPGLGGGMLLAGGTGIVAGAPAGLAVLVLVVTAAVGLSLYRYGRLPGVRRRKRLRQEAAYLDQVLARLRRQAAEQAEARQALLARRERLKEEHLRALQEQALHDRLKYHFIDEVRQIEGLSHKVVVRLKAAGIRTAVHVTPERMQRVTGLSEASRARVAMWRAALVATYEKDLPEALSPAERRRIDRYVEHRLAALDAGMARLREKMTLQEEERAALARRAASCPQVGYGAYLRYLLRLRPLPVRKEVPSPPPPGRRPAVSVTSPPAPERPWWQG